VTIDTLDNPGWRAKIDLVGTPLADASFDRHEIHRSDDDWVACWVVEDAFHAACGPRNLEEALQVFVDWADV
jgi:immunity protein 53 of polymorphic toxin system